MQRLLSLLIICLMMGGLTAQDLYTVRVGMFRDVKADDFNNLKSLGFVYGSPGADNTTEVFVGQFTDQNKATSVASNLLNQGFRNAQAFALSAATGQQVTVIQLGLHSGDRAIDWAGMERAGQLYVESVDGLSKIVTGIYPDGPTALKFLTAIKELGYRDAFIKRINNARLIPVSTFETGIKKPLIPITIQDNVPLNPASAPNTDNVPATAGPVVYGSTASSRSPEPAAAPTVTLAPSAVPSNAPFVLPAEANAPGLPAIDGKTKRHSAAELQRLLKEKGYYDSSIDGFYGPGTTSAYLNAWDGMPEIRKYRLLSSTAFSPARESRDAASQWPEVSVLLTVAEDIAAGTANSTRATQMVQQRAGLFNATTALSPVAATRARAWATTIWTNLEEWAIEDPLHAQIFGAFRLSYHQSQVRLEDRFMDAGMNATDARDMATAMLQNLIGAQLDRFL